MIKNNATYIPLELFIVYDDPKKYIPLQMLVDFYRGV